jgi:hypothetical protein
MKTITPVLLLLLMASGVECRTAPSASGLSEQSKCQHEWVYREYSVPIRGQVVFYAHSTDLCGLVATAAVTLVKISAQDTIRVLDLCYLGDPIPVGATVTIQPIKAPGFTVDVAVDPWSCLLKSTCFGTVKTPP